MNAKLMIDIFQMIFTEATMAKIRLLTSPAGEVEKVVLDVHGLTCREAIRFINNVVNLTRGESTVEVIHGYRRGTKIKDSLRQRFSNPKISIMPDQWNLGVTYLRPAELKSNLI